MKKAKQPKFKKPARMSEKVYGAICEVLAGERSLHKLAIKYGATDRGIREAIKRHNIPYKKLTLKDKAQWLEHKFNYDRTYIAKMLGVHKSQISRALGRKVNG